MQYEPLPMKRAVLPRCAPGALTAGLAGMVLAPAGAHAEEEEPTPKEVYQVRLVVDGPIIAVGALAGLLRYPLVAAVTAAAYTMRLRHGERVWPWLVTAAVGGSLVVERVASGHHFPSDTLVGLATGISIGLAVPWLHARTAGVHLALVPVPSNSGVTIAGAF